MDTIFISFYSVLFLYILHIYIGRYVEQKNILLNQKTIVEQYFIFACFNSIFVFLTATNLTYSSKK